jgi:hypothetical protein
MEKISDVKKVYTIYTDLETRGFMASLRRLQKDCAEASAANNLLIAKSNYKSLSDDVKQNVVMSAADKNAVIAEAKKAVSVAKAAAAAAEQSSAERKNAISALWDVMQRKGLRAEDINKDFLLQWIPQRFNANNVICSVKLVEIADEKEIRDKYAAFPSMLVEREERLFIYKPLLLFTANSFLTLFLTAATQRSKAAKETESAADKERKAAEKAERRAKSIAAMRAKVAAYDAEIEAAQSKAEKAA